MRSYLNPDKFFKKMKKKPELQRVLDNISGYTDEQINALSGSHFPQWIKEQLIELRKRNGKTADDVAEEIAAMMNRAAHEELVFKKLKGEI